MFRLSAVFLVTCASIGSATGGAIPNRTTVSRYTRSPGPRKRRSPSTLLLEHTIHVRGGGSGLFPFRFVDRDFMAKAADIVFMGQASTAWLAPHRTCEKYGLSDRTLNVAANRKLATAYLGSAVLMYGVLFQKCTHNTAIGAAAVTWMMEQLRSRLLYEAEIIGKPVLNEYLIALCAVLTAYATLYNTPLAPLAIKISALLQLGNGLCFFAAPITVCKFWRVPIAVTATPQDRSLYPKQIKEFNETLFLHRYMGVALIFSGLLQAVLAWDGSIYQAIGSAYGFLFSINLWSFLKTSDFKRLARSSAPVQKKQKTRPRWSALFFPAFNGVVASTLLLGGRTKPSTTPIAP